MLKWLWYKLIWPPSCDHLWEELHRAEIYDDEHKFPIRIVWLYRCKKCGTSKKYHNP